MLIPNGTADRLKYIAKTFGSRPLLVLDMIDVVAQTVGEDRWRFAIRDAANADKTFTDDVRHYGIHSVQGLWNPGAADPPKEYVSAVIDLVSQLPGFRGGHQADPLFPWMATQLNREAKSVERLFKSPGFSAIRALDLADYRTMLNAFRESGTLLSNWFAATRLDLTKLSAEDVLDAAHAWGEVQGSVELQQGEVVYEFDDGYTVQKLETEGQLDAEGEAMQHCVGSYCTEVKRGNVEIYSIRDQKGQPHVTIEYDPNSRFVKQIKGKQNDEPAPKYKPYIDTFIETLPAMPKREQEIYDLLNQQSDLDSDDELQSLTQEWAGIVHDAAELKEWLNAGVMASRPSFVESLQVENVEPSELGAWPLPVIIKLEEDSDENLIRLARFYARLGTLERSDVGTVASQIPLGLDEPVRQPKSLRPSRTSAGAHLQPSLTLGGTAFDHWDFNNFDDDELEQLVEADAWAESSADWDPRDEEPTSPNNFAPWYLHFFTPDQAVEWKDLDWPAPYHTIYADDAAVLRNYRITPKQVEEAIESKRLDGTDARYPRHVVDVLTSATPNRRRARR